MPWISLGRVACFASLALLSLATSAGGAEPVDFRKQIQPILAEHCTLCHGADANERRGGLRLDLKDSAFKGGDSGEPAIVAGQPATSELIRRITSTDPGEVMPPPSQKNALTPAQVELLRRWVEQGADYRGHWAFESVQKPLVPEGALHPIDAFVRAGLRERGLEPSPAADNATLCRRLYLDVVGLPPSPEQLAEFEREGLGATLKKLLASERYGEKWARHWLDAARYSDTNGYEKDLAREQWIWRDWVVRAYNTDMPYDQFLVEQIAGDLLPNATQDQLIATGFLRNSMINEEGAIVPEQFRMAEMFDRLDCIGKAVLGLTIQCAQCHSHKFDPISHTEYYGLFSFLNNTYEAQSWVYSHEQLRQLDDLKKQEQALLESWKAAHPNWSQDLATWEQNRREQLPRWEPVVFFELGSISGLSHPTQERDRSILMKGHTSGDVFFIGTGMLDGATGLRLEALTHGDLPFNGPGRSGRGTFAIHELEVFLQRPGAADWEKQKLVNATADFSEPEQKQPDGKKPRGPVALLIDGTDDSTWVADRGQGVRNQPVAATVQFEKPLSAPAETKIKVVLRMGDMLGCCRVSLTTAPNPVSPGFPHAGLLALEFPEPQRTPAERQAVFEAWCSTLTDGPALLQELAKVRVATPVAPTSVLHLSDRDPRDPRATYRLDRGNWDQPREEVPPQVPTAFHPMQPGTPANRLGLARWLTDRQSPLTARVAVNRVWQALFGVGLVETAEDFGTRTAVPPQLALLDWLAVDFIEHGYSQKHLLETILTSQTWQQSSHASPAALEADPTNVWLARGPRFRADAEVVRDIALGVSGLIHHRLGGPSVIPPVPQNVLDYNYVYPGYWKPAEGPERYRRTLYGFRKRSMPDPVMSNFDAPNGDFACARRIRSNSPLAALTTLNEPVFVEAARALALRILREGGNSDDSRIDRAFRLCVLRAPSPAEQQALRELLASRRQRLAEGWLNPREVTTGDPAKLPALPPGTSPQDAAAWTLVSRVLLNLDETISKN
jgi:mono/diheme cytochrome c family protein